MMDRRFGIALSCGVAAALLVGCAGTQLQINASGATSDRGDTLPYHKTFHYTGKKQSFVVPSGVTSSRVALLARLERTNMGSLRRGAGAL